MAAWAGVSGGTQGAAYRPPVERPRTFQRPGPPAGPPLESQRVRGPLGRLSAFLLANVWNKGTPKLQRIECTKFLLYLEFI